MILQTSTIKLYRDYIQTRAELSLPVNSAHHSFILFLSQWQLWKQTSKGMWGYKWRTWSSRDFKCHMYIWGTASHMRGVFLWIHSHVMKAGIQCACVYVVCVCAHVTAHLPSQHAASVSPGAWSGRSWMDAATTRSRERKTRRPRTLRCVSCRYLLCQAPINHPCIPRWNNGAAGGYSKSQAFPCTANTSRSLPSWPATSLPHVSIVCVGRGGGGGGVETLCTGWSIFTGVTWLQLSIAAFCSLFTPLRIHSRNAAATDTHSDNLRGLRGQQVLSIAPWAPSTSSVRPTVLLLMTGKPGRNKWSPRRGRKDACPSTTETGA